MVYNNTIEFSIHKMPSPEIKRENDDDSVTKMPTVLPIIFSNGTPEEIINTFELIGRGDHYSLKATHNKVFSSMRLNLSKVHIVTIKNKSINITFKSDDANSDKFTLVHHLNKESDGSSESLILYDRENMNTTGNSENTPIKTIERINSDEDFDEISTFDLDKKRIDPTNNYTVHRKYNFSIYLGYKNENFDITLSISDYFQKDEHQQDEIDSNNTTEESNTNETNDKSNWSVWDKETIVNADTENK